MFNFDIATGKISTTETPDYASKGPKDVYDIRNKPVKDPGSQCYVLDQGQCTAEQWKTVMNGTALIKNWIVVDANTSYLFPELVGNGTSRPSGTSSASAGSPQYTGAASSGRIAGRVMGVEIGIVRAAVLGAMVGSLVVL